MAKKNKGLAIIDPNVKKITEPITDIRKHKSETELNRVFIDKLKQEVNAKLILNNGKAATFTNNELLKILIKYLDLKIRVDKSKSGDTYNTVMILDANNPVGVWKPLKLERYITLMSSVIEIKDIKRVTDDIQRRFANLDPDLFDIPIIKLPPAGIILAPNCIINMKTLQQANNRDAFGKFDFVSTLKFRVLPKDNVDPLMLEIVKRIHKDWSENDKDANLYLKQLEFAAMEGDGRKVYHVLKGDGGNGKSTFLFILENLAGEDYTTKLDLQNLMRDNSLEHITPSMKLIVGHDMSTNAKLSSEMLSRFKEFTMGEGFQIEVKYKPNQLCQTFGLKVQNTNSDIAFFENSTAIKRRLIVFEWTNTDFSKLTSEESTFDLDALVGISDDANPDFYEALIANMFDELEYFNKFIQVQRSVEYTDEMVSNSDQVYRFLVWMRDQDLMLFTVYPINILYQMYALWMKEENPGSAPLKRRGFTDRVKKLSQQFGFEFVNKRRKINSISLLEFNVDLLNETFFNNNIKYNKFELTTYMEKQSDKITDTDVEELEIQLADTLESDEFSLKDLIILKYLVSNGNVLAASKLNDND